VKTKNAGLSRVFRCFKIPIRSGELILEQKYLEGFDGEFRLWVFIFVKNLLNLSD